MRRYAGAASPSRTGPSSWRRLLAHRLGALAPLATAALAGCSAAADRDCVRVVSWADYRELAIDQEIVDSFRVAHPEIPVCYESLEGAGIYREKVLTSIAAGTPPDVFLLDGEDVPAFVNRGVVLNLAPFLERAGVDFEVYHPRLRELFHRDGGVWAFPKDFTPMVVYYNKDVFDAAGVPYPADDWTWADFLETARALTRDTNGDGEVDTWGFGWQRQFFYILPWIWAGGGTLISPDGEGASGHLDSPETVAAVRFYLDLVTEHELAPRIEMMRRGAGGMIRLFASGRVAMIQSGHWSVPTLNPHENAGRLRYGVAPMPVRAGHPPVTTLYASGWAVPRVTAHRRWAIQVAAYLASEPAQRIRARGGLALPAIPTVAEEVAARDTTGRQLVFLEAAAHGRHSPGTRLEPWREIQDLMLDLLDRPLVRGEPVDAVAADLARRVDALLARRRPNP
jgi:multiple sugar transport system substrate-binding protein